MSYDYDEMLGYASELGYFQGYLDSEDEKKQAEIMQSYTSARKKFVYELLQDQEDWQAALRVAHSDLDSIVANDPDWVTPVEYVKDDLTYHIENEGKKSPTIRKIVRWTPAALGAIAVIIYFGVRVFSGIDISQPIETKIGIQERAAAVEKVIRYDDWASTRVRRGGFVKGILLWPIEPSQEEMSAASEFVSLTLDGHSELSKANMICGYLTRGNLDSLSDSELELVGKVAEYIQDENAKWLEPPVLTIVEPIKTAFPCG